MKYFIYARKSTDSEEKQVLSIKAQLAELKEFATKLDKNKSIPLIHCILEKF